MYVNIEINSHAQARNALNLLIVAETRELAWFCLDRPML